MPKTNSLENPIFSIVPGRGHGPECMERVRQSLRDRGFESVVPQLRIEDPAASLDDHAENMVEAEASLGERRVIRVGWSWGANVIARATDESEVDKLIFIAPAFHEATIANHPNRDKISLKHGMLYEMLSKEMLIKFEGEERKELARLALYHDIEDETVLQEAVDNLRPHPKREDEPALKKFPIRPLGYIALLRDRVITLDCQRQTALALGVPAPNELDAGHAPMYSQPGPLAKLLKNSVSTASA